MYNDVYEQLERAEAGIKYLDNILADPTLEKWVQREYQGVRNDSLIEVEKLKQAIELFEQFERDCGR